MILDLQCGYPLLPSQVLNFALQAAMHTFCSEFHYFASTFSFVQMSLSIPSQVMDRLSTNLASYQRQDMIPHLAFSDKSPVLSHRNFSPLCGSRLIHLFFQYVTWQSVLVRYPSQKPGNKGFVLACVGDPLCLET